MPAMSIFGLFKRTQKIPTLKEEDIPRYPPFLRGLPSVTEGDLLESQKDLLTRLAQSVRCRDEYKKWYVPAMTQYARFVHLLPASESHHHCAQGGLLRHGLESAYWAVQFTRGVMFALDSTPGERRKVRPCWELAIFLAALGHDMGKAVTDMAVTDAKSKTTWDPYTEDIVAWARRNDIDRYFVRWKQDRKHKQHELMTPLVIHYLLTDEVKSYLSSTAPGALEQLMSAISGTMTGRNVVQEIMQKADRISAEKDLRERPVDSSSTSMQVGVPVERNLLDAMRRLIKKGDWKGNEAGGRVWIIDKGLYVVWRQGTREILQLLDADKVPGVPRDPDTLADILTQRDLAVPWETREGQRRYWRVAPEMLQKEGRELVELQCLRFKAAELLIDPPPASIEGTILLETAEAPTIQPPQDVPLAQKAPEEEKIQKAPDTSKKLEPPKAKPGEEAWLSSAPPQPVENPVLPAETAIVPPELKPPQVVAPSSEVPLPEEPPEMAMAELILPQPEKTESAEKKKKTRQSGPNAVIPKVNGRPVKEKIAVMVDEDVPLVREETKEEEHEPTGQEKDAEAFFEKHGMAGEVLKAVAEDLSKRRLKWGQAAIVVPGKKEIVAIRYPNALDGYGITPKDLLLELAEHHWIAEDYGGKKVFDVEGFGKGTSTVKAILLEEEVSLHLLSIAQKTGAATSPEPSKETKEKKRPQESKKETSVKPRNEEPAAEETETPASIQTLISGIQKNTCPLEVVQEGGMLFLHKGKTVEWIQKYEKCSISKARRILMDTKLLQENRTKTDYLMLCDPLLVKEAPSEELRDTV